MIYLHHYENISLHGPEFILHFGTELAKNTQLTLSSLNVRAHEVQLTSVCAHEFQKIAYSDIIPFVYIGKEEIHKYMQYEVSMNIYGQDSKSKKSTKMAAI